mmetsp:Transcript_13004/g.22400  ORF Transcript_13004/g.22400 Transcript_13004/m.22400 type:complete len:1168 (-) Transcript_13004:88-3591(-)
MDIEEKSSKVDVVAKDLSEENFGWQVSQHLKIKAFCVIDPGLDKEVTDGFMADVKSLDKEDRFYEPSKMFLDGLLGTGSSRIAELDLFEQADRKSHGDSLEALDYTLGEYESTIFQYFPVDVMTRTGSVLNESGDNAGSNVIDDFEVAKWLTVFVHHKLMCIWFLGPEEGTLELSPFDGESNVTKVSGKPGTLVILRPDLLAHTFESRGTSYCMTCFYQSDGHKSKHKMDEIDVMTPTAAALDEYAFNRVESVRNQYEDDDPQRPRLPRHWELVGSHQGYMAQRIQVRTGSVRYPCSYSHKAWAMSLNMGTDYGEEVPISRWDHGQVYAAYEVEKNGDWWLQGKSNCRHGGFIDGLELFDNKFFRLSAAEAGGMDPGQRMILEAGYDAMHQDGYTQKNLMNCRGAVMVGSGAPEWAVVPKEGGGVCGCGNSIACGRVSFTFGMKGPCFSVELGNASALAVLSEACTLLSLGRGKWEPPPFSVVSCYHLQLAAQLWVQLTATGLCSKSGRCWNFDASGDGFVRSDNCTAIICKNSMTTVDGEPVLRDDWEKCIGYVAGNGLVQSGRRANMMTPDAMSMQEVCILAQRAAQISPLDVDGLECHSQGNILNDAMETASCTRAFRPDGMIGLDQTAPLTMMSLKGNMGDPMEGAGLQQLLKVLWGMKYGICQPTNSLRLLNPHMDYQICERPVNINTELMEYPLETAYAGVTSLSFAGLTAHVIFFGEMDRDACKEMEAKPRDQLMFWPSGGGLLADDQVPQKGYWIAGSWSNFEAVEMEKESKECFGYTFTMGENRWEHFQIWLDGKKTKALNPGSMKAPQDSPVHGPEDAMLFNTWMVDARPMPMYRDVASDEDAAEGAIVPSYYDVATEDTGEAGDQYRIRLRVAGKYRTVEWEKLNEQKPAEVPKGKYYVLGTWNDLAAQEMTCDSEAEGLYSCEVTLSEGVGGDFLISRNEDWMQVIYPTMDDWGAPTEFAEGPDAMQQSSTWHINGFKFDAFRIVFSRPEMKVTWKKIGSGELPPTIKDKLSMPEYHLTGSWNSFNSAFRMTWSGKAGAFLAYAELGESARLDFRVLRDGSPSAALYPSVEEAGLNEGDIMGPGNPDNADLFWSIGKDDDFGGKRDNAAKGKRYVITVTPTRDRSKIQRVDWKVTDSALAPLEDAVARGMLIYGL